MDQEALRLYSLSAAELGKSVPLSCETKAGTRSQSTTPKRPRTRSSIPGICSEVGEWETPVLNRSGETTWKYEDVDTYLSLSISILRRVIVQVIEAARKDQSPVSWRGTEIEGTLPLALYVEDFYLDYSGYHWKWPTHAINSLDTREGDRKRFEKPEKLSSKQRLYRPRQLIVLQNEEWQVVEQPPKELQFIFISYHWDSFRGSEDRVEFMARNARENTKDLLTADVNRTCDAIQESQFIALLLPDGKLPRKRNWGRLSSLWARLSLVADSGGSVRNSEELPGSVLAEHHEGLITFSRLELFSNAISALKARVTTNDFTGVDLAYVLMGLLHYWIDSDLQVIARLSLANDNERLIERLTSTFPKAIDNKDKVIY
ncbi:MAG: hypothetical protein Q9217_003346 [Psora testacea]